MRAHARISTLIGRAPSPGGVSGAGRSGRGQSDGPRDPSALRAVGPDSLPCHAMSPSGRQRRIARRRRRQTHPAFQLCLHGVIDVAMDVIGAEQFDEPVRVEDVVDRGPDLRQAELDVFRLEKLVDLVELRGALRVDEVHAFEVTHEGLQQPAVGEVANSVLERLGRGEEEAAVEP